MENEVIPTVEEVIETPEIIEEVTEVSDEVQPEVLAEELSTESAEVE